MIYVGKVALGQDPLSGRGLLWFPSVRLVPPNIRIHFSLIYPRLIKHFCLSLQRYLKAVHIDRKSVDNGKFSYVSSSSTRRMLPIERVYTYNKIFFTLLHRFDTLLILSFFP